ncbi:beta-1,6-N-acetylglucosaminyltransferase [Salinimicrobium sp. GXAS 041]|uniref:beta-1,6-N-acetylglucosaminyltransferase n=1 Tax=Salinimicrobium sp. GXAS 041 TaxID=3400806 RepID=UPI003C73593C
MHLNYLVLAHNSPEQLWRLIVRLHGSEVYFYIHIDRKSDQLPFEELLSTYQNVKFVHQRENVIWGDVSMVTATIELMKQVSKDKKNGYCILLSAQDYPIVSNQNINIFFKKNYGKCFISTFKIPHPKWENGGLLRLNKYKINKSSERKHFLILPSIYHREFYTVATLGKLNFLRKSGRWTEFFRIFKNRKFPSILEPFGGGQWWALPTAVVNKILNFHDTHTDFLEYHKYTLVPDEIFFHSILMYLKNNEDFQIERSVTYVNWERPSGPLPVTFKLEDFGELQEASRSHLFARKFDLNWDEEILNEIDKQLLT